jgi:hypothetical protein
MRKTWRRAVVVACAAVAITASGAVPASAASYPYEAAFMANSGSLWLWTTGGGANMSLGMAADTSPSITALATGGYQFAFQANTGDLWIVGAAGNVNTGHQMMGGSSPVISALKGSGYVVAWADPDGNVWTYTPSSGYTETSYNLGTESLSGDQSVAVAGLATGGYEVALNYFGIANEIAYFGSAGSGTISSAGGGIVAVGSMSITGLAGGSFAMAWSTGEGSDNASADTNNVSVYSPASGILNYFADATSSPSIAGLSTGGWEVAYESYPQNNVAVLGSDGSAVEGLGMTSPSPLVPAEPQISSLAGGGYEVAFQANNGNLWTFGSAGTHSTVLGMNNSNTSPDIAGWNAAL